MIDPTVLAEVTQIIKQNGLTVAYRDIEKPWGGYFAFEEEQIDQFAAKFFPDLKLDPPAHRLPMKPKLLIVAPGKQLSFQYHDRRSERWHVVKGEVGVVVSDDNDLTPQRKLNAGQEIMIARGERHRLIGLQEWGIVAEIWVHNEPAHPSDENDIVRLQDDFGR